MNTLDRVFADPQIQSRLLLLDLPHPTAGAIRLVGPPWKLADSPSPDHRSPPCLGQHTTEVLRDWLDLAAADIERLHSAQAV